MQFEIITYSNKPTDNEKNKIVNFLFTHLDKYGDPIPAIEKAVNYALHEGESFGGFIVVAYENENIIGAVVVNKTGMKEYIPENILVYIATHRNYRGKGIGKELMKRTIDHAEGSVALHVEAENPARFLYEKMGFQNKYVEMRLIRN
ncbi:MAG: GNAT family N-acetyltransferase [Bacteroidales bacterium]|nr:GNAT family N-acetyltransferase [Bacteroidales bacterium]HPD94902.1 GNAT family N-acetyltransferase [Tenuifilaceae bacterium]HRX30683.1 GNAT family N-acetyltransferase [Tenuifilaceae bacterium]